MFGGAVSAANVGAPRHALGEARRRAVVDAGANADQMPIGADERDALRVDGDVAAHAP